MSNRFSRLFDGAAYASIADGAHTGLDLAGELTIESWIKPSGSGAQCIAGKWGDDGAYSYLFRWNGSQSLTFEFDGNGSGAYTSKIQSTVSLGSLNDEWHHVAVTHSLLADEIRFFVDGTQIGSTQSGALAIFNGGAAFMVGGRVNSTPWYFDGGLDDVRVWNDVRTPAEILANYSTELAGTEAGLVAYYRFEDPESATALVDEVGNNDLTDSGTELAVDPAFGGASAPPSPPAMIADDTPGGIGLV